MQKFSGRKHREAHAGFFRKMPGVPGDQCISSCGKGSFEKRFVITVRKVYWVGQGRGINPSGSNENQDCLNPSRVQFKFRPFQDLQILRQYIFVTYDEQVALKYVQRQLHLPILDVNYKPSSRLKS